MRERILNSFTYTSVVSNHFVVIDELFSKELKSTESNTTIAMCS